MVDAAGLGPAAARCGGSIPFLGTKNTCKTIQESPNVTVPATLPPDYGEIHIGIVDLLEAARRGVARSVNALMTASYWEVGRRIVEFEQTGEDRAAYGEALIKRLGDDLSERFGRGFGWRNLAQMRAFYLAWPAEMKLQTPSAKSNGQASASSLLPKSPDLAALAGRFPLPWSVYVRLLSVKSTAARTF